MKSYLWEQARNIEDVLDGHPDQQHDTPHDVDRWAAGQRLARACELDARLHDAAMHLRDVEEVHGLAEAVELARYLIADAEAVLIGVEDALFSREGRLLCLCGEGVKSCKCGNDLARSVLRRLAEQRARWAREDAEEG